MDENGLGWTQSWDITQKVNRRSVAVGRGAQATAQQDLNAFTAERVPSSTAGAA